MGTRADDSVDPSRHPAAHEGTDIGIGAMGMHMVTRNAIDYVRDNLSGSLNGSTVAAALGVSRKTLCAHFKYDTGETFARYVWRRRVEQACDLLDNTDLDIAQIAYQTGFSSQSHLQTAFKRATGLTPRQWRAKRRRAD